VKIFIAYRFPQAKSKVCAILMWVDWKALQKLPPEIIARHVRTH